MAECERAPGGVAFLLAPLFRAVVSGRRFGRELTAVIERRGGWGMVVSDDLPV